MKRVLAERERDGNYCPVRKQVRKGGELRLPFFSLLSLGAMRVVRLE
jgi:hypothetical protein